MHEADLDLRRKIAAEELERIGQQGLKPDIIDMDGVEWHCCHLCSKGYRSVSALRTHFLGTKDNRYTSRCAYIKKGESLKDEAIKKDAAALHAHLLRQSNADLLGRMVQLIQKQEEQDKTLVALRLEVAQERTYTT
jgi:hypothetical protein